MPMPPSLTSLISFCIASSISVSPPDLSANNRTHPHLDLLPPIGRPRFLWAWMTWSRSAQSSPHGPYLATSNRASQSSTDAKYCKIPYNPICVQALCTSLLFVTLHKRNEHSEGENSLTWTHVQPRQSKHSMSWTSSRNSSMPPNHSFFTHLLMISLTFWLGWSSRNQAMNIDTMSELVWYLHPPSRYFGPRTSFTCEMKDFSSNMNMSINLSSVIPPQNTT